ncbi:MAG: hypothetical protein AAGH15_21300 [Myxococcota bacterium]
MSERDRPTHPGPPELPDADDDPTIAEMKLPSAPPAPGGLVVEVRECVGMDGIDDGWCAAEVWTRNRVYSVDGEALCRQVRDLQSGYVVPDHPIVGQRLLGGQRRGEGGRIEEISFPFPHEGSMAVFSRPVGRRSEVSETSAVTRVVLRQRVVRVGEEGPPWGGDQRHTWPPVR